MPLYYALRLFYSNCQILSSIVEASEVELHQLRLHVVAERLCIVHYLRERVALVVNSVIADSRAALCLLERLIRHLEHLPK